MTTRSVGRRRAFTLLELLVVIGIMLVLATLAVLFLPNLDRHKGVPNAVTQIHGWINLAKQQAIRDGAARGVRLIDDGTGTGHVVEIQYIEQPEPVAPRGPGIKIYIRTEPVYDPILFSGNPGFVGFTSVVTLYQDQPAPNPPYVVDYINPPPQPSWINWDGVQAGDTFQLTNSPAMYARIMRFTSPQPDNPYYGTPPTNPTGPSKRSQLVLDRIVEGTEVFPNPTPPPPFIGNVITSSNNFRVIRQPRPLVGEPTLQLNKDVYIDLTRSTPYPLPSPPYPPPAFGAALGQTSAVWGPGAGYLDILFNPNGVVANAPTGSIVLWIQSAERQGNPQGGGNDALLLAIYTRTGKIAPHYVYDITGFSPYLNTYVGTSPGL